MLSFVTLRSVQQLKAVTGNCVCLLKLVVTYSNNWYLPMFLAKPPDICCQFQGFFIVPIPDACVHKLWKLQNFQKLRISRKSKGVEPSVSIYVT